MTAPTTPTSPSVSPIVPPHVAASQATTQTMAQAPALGPGDTHDGFFLWGAPKAGKSGFIGALYGLSRGDDVERWTAHPKDCDDPHTQEMVLRAHEELSERRNTKTGVRDTPYRPLRLTLRKMKAGRQVGELRVALVDPAGEFSTDPGHRLSSAGKHLYRQVATSHGVLWLFEATPDGAASTLDRLLILEQLVALLEAGGAPQLDLPVAICLSKIDCLSEEKRRSALANPTQALLDHLGVTSLTWFEAVCPTLKCFAVSSAGVVPDKVRPIGLNEVLDWLEEQRNRRVRTVRAAAVRSRAFDFVRRWSAIVAKGTAVVALAAGTAYGGTRVIDRLRSKAGAEVARADSATPRPTKAATAPAAAPTPVMPVRARASTGDVTPRTPPRLTNATATFDLKVERDSMRDAFARGMAVQRDGQAGGIWFRRAYVHATRVIDHGTAGSRQYTPERLVRARSCILGDLGCSHAMVTEDLTWVLVFGDDAQRRVAVRLLERIGA